MKWIIEDIFNNTCQITEILKEKNISHEVINKFSVHKHLNKISKDEYFYYGSIFGCREANKNNGTTFLNEKNLLCSSYYPYYSDFLLNKNYVIVPLIELKHRFNFFKNAFQSNKLFVRPNSPVKIFTGQVIEESNIQEFEDCFHSLVIVSSPKQIEAEYRFFISNNHVVSGSQYIKNNDIDINSYIDPKAMDLAQIIVNQEWKPDTLFIADIAISNNNPYLIEFNSISCADYYEMDLNKIISEIIKHIDNSRNN